MRTVAKPKRELTEDERAALAIEYDYVMRDSPRGEGWAAQWEAEDAVIKQQGIPDAEPSKWLSAKQLKQLAFWVDERCGDLMPPSPWMWTPCKGALKDPFARAIRWAYHHGYPRPFEMEAEDLAADLLNLEEGRMRVMGNDQPTYTSDEVASMVRQAYGAGRAGERRAAAQRAAAQSKQGAPPKGIPREAQGGRDIRRAVLIAFFRKRGIPVSRPEGSDFRSACDAVALAEAVCAKVRETPPSDPESRVPMFYGETAISLLAHTPEVQASKVIADEAWDAAGRIVKRLVVAGEQAAKVLWKTEQAKFCQIAPPVKAETSYETVRTNWHRFRRFIDAIETAPK